MDLCAVNVKNLVFHTNSFRYRPPISPSNFSFEITALRRPTRRSCCNPFLVTAKKNHHHHDNNNNNDNDNNNNSSSGLFCIHFLPFISDFYFISATSNLHTPRYLSSAFEISYTPRFLSYPCVTAFWNLGMSQTQP